MVLEAPTIMMRDRRRDKTTSPRGGERKNPEHCPGRTYLTEDIWLSRRGRSGAQARYSRSFIATIAPPSPMGVQYTRC